MESYYLMGTEFTFGMIKKKVLQMDVDDSCTVVSVSHSVVSDSF